MKKLKVMIVVGTRPEIIRLSAVMNRLEESEAIEHMVVHTGQNWNRRFREYSERLKSSELAVVTEVLRELLLISRTKDLSFGERRLQEQAMGLVTGELSEVLQVEEDTLRDELLELYAPPPPPEDEKEQPAGGTTA